MGIRETLLRSIYLVSKTPYLGVHHIPILSIHFCNPEINFDAYEGIIITSKQGALALNHYTPDWKKLQVICVGKATAEVMKQLGAVHIDIADGYGDTIFDTLKSHKEKRWLYCRPKIIASSWPKKAQELGLMMDEVVIYETTCNEKIGEIAIASDSVLIFTSPSSIECFTQKISILPTHTVVVIGKTTQKALSTGIKSVLSETTSVESCVEKARELSFLRV